MGDSLPAKTKVDIKGVIKKRRVPTRSGSYKIGESLPEVGAIKAVFHSHK